MPLASIQLTASAISARLAAPVDMMMGFLKSHMNSMKGRFVRSEEEILNTSIMSLRNLADSTSNGVDMKAIPA